LAHISEVTLTPCPFGVPPQLSGVGSLEGQDYAGAARGGVRRNEHSQRRLIEDIHHEKSPSG